MRKGSEIAATAGECGNGHTAPDFLVRGNPGLKYYPTTDLYNDEGLAWIHGGFEIERQLFGIISKLKQKSLVNGMLERISQLLEMLEGESLPWAISGLLRQYGYGEVVDQAIARVDASRAAVMPPQLQ